MFSVAPSTDTILSFDTRVPRNADPAARYNGEKFCNEESSNPLFETTTTATSTVTTTTTVGQESLEDESPRFESSLVGHVEYVFGDARMQFKSDSMFNYKGFILKWEKLSYCDFKLSKFGRNLDEGEAQFFKERKRIVC